MPQHDPGDNTQTSKMRLLHAGKTLFARKGYEQTSTAAIARAAGSSESQLIRYFSGKAGLLEAVFNESWMAINEPLELQIAGAAHGRDAIVRILALMVEAFSRDHDIAFLFLFEGRRMRGGGSTELHLSEGFGKFIAVVDAQIARGREDGSFRTDIDPLVLRSAMLGCAEGMTRDRVMCERSMETHPFDDESIFRTFAAMVNALAPS